jgi:3-hydroxybutyryl-CoA dehydrogenase
MAENQADSRAEIRTIAVIGAGARGCDIAQFSAVGGFRTILEDILPASLRRAQVEIRAALELAIATGELTRPQADAALARIQYASSVEQAAREADLVIEAVPDELESKLEIFTLLDKVARPGTILACSSSGFSVTELASVTYRAEKVLGMRFWTSAEGTQLLEIIRGRRTDEDTVALCSSAGRKTGLRLMVIDEVMSSPG